MSTTSFFGSDGSLSSFRSSFGPSSITSYAGSLAGGITSRIGNVASRMSNAGQYLGSSVKLGSHTTYFGRNGGVSTHLASF